MLFLVWDPFPKKSKSPRSEKEKREQTKHSYTSPYLDIANCAPRKTICMLTLGNMMENCSL